MPFDVHYHIHHSIARQTLLAPAFAVQCAKGALSEVAMTHITDNQSIGGGANNLIIRCDEDAAYAVRTVERLDM